MAGLLGTDNLNKYRYGLQTGFNTSAQPGTSFHYDPDSNTAQGGPNQGVIGDDPDVAYAKNLANEEAQARSGQNPGVSFSTNDALLNQLTAKIGQKNQLGEEINTLPGQFDEQQGLNLKTAQSTLGQGLTKTRQNYNSRGLLYSGMRQGGEQSVRNSVASGLAQSQSGTRHDYQTALDTAKSAYGAVDLAGQEQQLQLAHQAFESVNQNNIARAQAMQQLGYGVGQGAGLLSGYAAGGFNSGVNPTAGWQPQQLQQPQLGSQYGQNSQWIGNYNQPEFAPHWYNGDVGTEPYGTTDPSGGKWHSL